MGKFTAPSIIYGEVNFHLPSDMNYGFFLLNILLKNKDKIALIDGATHKKFTYGELAQAVIDTSTALTQLGVKVGDVIGICSENRPEFLTTAIAANCVGAVITFINNAYSNDELRHTIGISRPKIMFVSYTTLMTYYASVRNLAFIKKYIVFGTEFQALGHIISFKEFMSYKLVKEAFKPVDFKGVDKTALILYSSGTTGLPKGAKLSHSNLISSGLKPLAYNKDLVCLSIAPWSNTVGIICTTLEIINGGTVVYLNKFREETYLKCIEKYKVGILLAVPPLLVLLNQSKILNKFSLLSVEIIYCGGAPLNEIVIENAKKTFPKLRHVLQGYGTTETTGALTDDRESAPKQGSVGRICDGNIIKIVDIETRQILGPNKPGEVCVKGPVLFQGYIGKDLKDDLDEDGFYKTGDVAYYDEDGYFFVVDRLKELIKYKAGQVAPTELEAILREHPAVQDVGVVGAPDPVAGELPTAFVVKAPGAAVSEKELVDYVAPKVSSWKQLRGGVKFVPEIPKTPSGKILRRQLRDLLRNPASKL